MVPEASTSKVSSKKVVKSRNKTKTLDFVSLCQQAESRTHVVYRPDGQLCFVAMGSVVKIYNPQTAQLLSSLPTPASGENVLRDRTVTAIQLRPDNDTQLLVATLDGFLRIWDYLNGRVLREIDIGFPILRLCMHASFKHDCYLAVRGLRGDSQKKRDFAIFRISLKSEIIDRKKLIELRKSIIDLQMSSDGAFVVAITSAQLLVTQTSNLKAGWVRIPAPNLLTCLAVHHSETFLATGDAKGMIKLYHPFDLDWWAQRAHLQSTTEERHPLPPPVSTSTLHWHAHPVNCISFTAGGYMLSGGEEGVLVFWQLASGQKDFLPLRESPIVSIACNSTDSQITDEAALILDDGTIKLVDLGQMQVRRTISALKIASLQHDAKQNAESPIIRQPGTNNLILPSSHPAALQVYSVDADANLAEIEVAASNRVANKRGGDPIQPIRVTKAAITAQREDRSSWMATYQVWQHEAFAIESALKFWLVRKGEPDSYTLITEIDLSPKEAITSLDFSKATTNLLTTHTNGDIRIWRYVHQNQKGKLKSSWRCERSFRHRAEPTISSCWSEDGSLFAVAHPFLVSLWDAPTASLIRTFPTRDIGLLHSVAFAGQNDSILVVQGKAGITGWNLVNLQDHLHLNSYAQQMIPTKGDLLVVERKQLGTYPLSGKGKPEYFDLPFAAVKGQLLSSDTLSLAYTTQRGDVVLLGQGRPSDSPVNSISILANERKQLQLFEDNFGSILEDRVQEPPPSAFAAVDAASIFEQPAHLMPPLRLIWRDALLMPPLSKKMAEELQVQGDAIDAMDIDETKAEQTSLAKDQFKPLPAALVTKAFLSKWQQHK